MERSGPPPGYTGRPIEQLWSSPLSEVIGAAPASDLRPEWQERHRIYSLLTLSLVAAYFNGNKGGTGGSYPWRPMQAEGDHYRGGTYLGHNIAAIAVDPAGRVIDFDFNHNEIFNSSVEHAESRLLRRLFSLANLREDWSPPTRLAFFEFRAEVGLDPSASVAPGQVNAPIVPAHPYGSLLSGYTIYTSLESCAQCSGIMALARIKQVVFCQRDPGQFMVGYLMATLGADVDSAGNALIPPIPVSGDGVGLRQFAALDAAYATYRSGVGEDRPFQIKPDGRKDKSPSITSFLCTDLAQEILQGSRTDLDEMVLMYPSFIPDLASPSPHESLTNEQALRHSRDFFEYAVEYGRRGTPHQL
jgi:tRNA(Arg) A34 adenosine deaminase TadA